MTPQYEAVRSERMCSAYMKVKIYGIGKASVFIVMEELSVPCESVVRTARRVVYDAVSESLKASRP